MQEARTCPECQQHKNIQRQPSIELTTMVTPVPFPRWGLHIVGPFPLASKGRKYLFVTIDYFTKWVAEAIKSITEENIKQFMFRSIICQFDTPLQIITNNGT